MPESEQKVLDEAVYAAACAVAHYGYELTPEALKSLRFWLRTELWTTERNHLPLTSEQLDFCDTMLNPPLDYDHIVQASRLGKPIVNEAPGVRQR